MTSSMLDVSTGATLVVGADCELTLATNDALSVDSLEVAGKLFGDGELSVKSQNFYVSGSASGAVKYKWIDEPITVAERYDSAEHTDSNSPQIIRKFRVLGTWNEVSAYMAMCGYLGNRFQVVNNRPMDSGLPVTEIRQNPMTGIAGYEFEVTFSPLDFQEPDALEVEDYNYQFTTVGGTAHITHGFGTVSATTLDGSEPQDFDGGIGYNDAGGFDGCDVTFPSPQIKIGISLPKTFYTRQYRVLIACLTGGVNSTYFDGFAPGEVKFNGVDVNSVVFKNPYTGIKDYYWRATYNFIVSPNVYVPFGGRQILKPGWDYAWRLVEKRENPTTKKTETKVKQLNVERVYPVFDFAQLMIPTPP